MRTTRIAVLLVLLLALPVLGPAWASADNKHVRVSEYEEGHAYCPHRPIAVGPVVVPAGRCYKVAVLRDRRGAYLAFLDPGVRLGAGEPERLDGREGRRLSARILFLVPVPAGARIALIPVDTIQLIRLRQEDEEDDEDQPRISRSTLVVVVPASTVPHVSATFVISF